MTCKSCGKPANSTMRGYCDACDADRLRKALKELEWCDFSHNTDCCPVCGQFKPGIETLKRYRDIDAGHKDDCWLSKLLNGGD